MEKEGAFRFAYFTKKFDETCRFYEEELRFDLEHSWDRNEHDKGAFFQAGAGLKEVLHSPDDENHRHACLDYRSPQGAFMVIQVWDADGLFAELDSIGVPFEQELVNRSWGHRSFSVMEPNGLILFFFQERF